jgi:hypothetical protein
VVQRNDLPQSIDTKKPQNGIILCGKSGRERFVAEGAFRGAAYITLVTTCGAVRNEYLNDVQSVVTLDDLFTE